MSCASRSPSSWGFTRCLRAAACRRLHARFGLAQRFRVEVDARGVVAQLAHRLAGLRFGGLKQLHHRREAGIVRGKRAQPARHSRELGEDRALGFGQRLERGLRSGEQARAVREAGVLGGHEVPLACAQAELGELGGLLLEVGRARPRARRSFSRPRAQAPPGVSSRGTPPPYRVRAAAAPACASSSSRCDAARSSDWCACCPWMSTRRSPTSFSCASVARGR